MLVETKNVSTTLPADLVMRIDRRNKRKCITRAQWVRKAILKLAHEEGFIKATFDHTGDVYDLNLLEGVAA